MSFKSNQIELPSWDPITTTVKWVGYFSGTVSVYQFGYCKAEITVVDCVLLPAWMPVGSF